jgi:hypothetical protein
MYGKLECDGAFAMLSCPPHCQVCSPHVRFEVFMAVTVKNGVFRDVTPYGSCKNRRFRGSASFNGVTSIG